jgi:hypothetical protein
VTVTRLRGGGFLIATAVSLTFSLVGAGGSPNPSAAGAAPVFRPTTKVVLFTPAYSDPLVARLEAELEAVGIIVRRMDMPSDLQLDAVISREIASGASAVIRVIPRSRGTEVWTGDTTARVLRRRSIHADTSDAALSVIALRTVEFLRASLLEVRLRGATGAGVARSPSGPNSPNGQAPNRETATPPKAVPNERVPPVERGGATPAQTETFTNAPVVPIATRPPAAPASTSPAAPSTSLTNPSPAPGSQETSGAEPDASLARPAAKPTVEIRGASETRRPSQPPVESSRFEIAAGPAVLASPGGIAPVVSAATIGRGRITERSGMEIMAVFPVVPRRLTTPEGSTQVSAALFGLAADFRMTPPGPWMVDAAIGVCALMFRAVGTAGGITSVGQTKLAWKLATHVRFGAGRQIGRWLSIRADAIAGLMPASRVVLRYSDVDRATWGPVFVAGAVSVQAAW